MRDTKEGTIHFEVSKDGFKRIIMEQEGYWKP